MRGRAAKRPRVEARVEIADVFTFGQIAIALDHARRFVAFGVLGMTVHVTDPHPRAKRRRGYRVKVVVDATAWAAHLARADACGMERSDYFSRLVVELVDAAEARRARSSDAVLVAPHDAQHTI